MVLLARRGAGVDHTTAAANIAALVEVAAARPGSRILNSADPDAPSALEISRTIARLLGHEWREVLLDDEAPGGSGPDALGRAPPDRAGHDRRAELGYTPAGDYATTVAETVEWLVDAARGGDGARHLPPDDDEFFAPLFDYAAEDRWLAGR